MILKSLIVLSLIAFGYSKIVKFKDCGSLGGVIHSVDLSPCESDPCILHHSVNYTAHVNFTALVNSPSATTVVHGIIGGIPIPFPVPADCCKNHNLKCPIVSGVTDIYTNSIYCSPAYPKIRLVAKWEVKDDNKTDIMCFLIPLEIR